MTKLIIKYALILFVSLSLLKFLEFQFFSYKMSLETYLGIIAGVFLVAGIIISNFWSGYGRRDATKKHAQNEAQAQNDNERVNAATQHLDNTPPIDEDLLKQFSHREQQVLSLLCYGYTNKEIAKCLDISPNTVKTHLSKLFSKLGVSNRTQALSEAKLLKIIN